MRESVQVPHSAILEGPHVNWKHIDGPLMSWAGNIHWLTWAERIYMRAGRMTVDQIACERWPHLAQLRSTLTQRGEEQAKERVG